MGSPTERSIVDILRDIVGDVKGLIRSEILLARAEVREEISKGITAGKAIALGFLCGGLSVVFLLFGVASLLAIFIPLWLALFAVAGVLLVIGAIAVKNGRARLTKVDLTPHRAVGQLGENLKWAKQQTK